MSDQKPRDFFKHGASDAKVLEVSQKVARFVGDLLEGGESPLLVAEVLGAHFVGLLNCRGCSQIAVHVLANELQLPPVSRDGCPVETAVKN